MVRLFVVIHPSKSDNSIERMQKLRRLFKN